MYFFFHIPKTCHGAQYMFNWVEILPNICLNTTETSFTTKARRFVLRVKRQYLEHDSRIIEAMPVAYQGALGQRFGEDFPRAPVNSESQAAKRKKRIFKQTFPAEPDKQFGPG